VVPSLDGVDAEGGAVLQGGQEASGVGGELTQLDQAVGVGEVAVEEREVASVGVVEVDALGGPGVAETLGVSRVVVDLANLVSPLGVPLSWCSPHPAASTTSDATATRARHTRTTPADVPVVRG
jgi:hypothetical protein